MREQSEEPNNEGSRISHASGKGVSRRELKGIGIEVPEDEVIPEEDSLSHYESSEKPKADDNELSEDQENQEGDGDQKMQDDGNEESDNHMSVDELADEEEIKSPSSLHEEHEPTPEITPVSSAKPLEQSPIREDVNESALEFLVSPPKGHIDESPEAVAQEPMESEDREVSEPVAEEVEEPAVDENEDIEEVNEEVS